MEHKQELGHKEPCHPSQSHHPPLGAEDTSTIEEGVSFFHDFVAGGVAGSASVVVGHPFDTLKVRMQTGGFNGSIISQMTSTGGLTSLYRGMAAPLSTACIVNAIIFSSYGWSSRLYDDYIAKPPTSAVHDTTLKAFTCGSFAGLIQGLVICPMEHMKCRLQVQPHSTPTTVVAGAHASGTASASRPILYKGPVDVARSIYSGYGIAGLYRGWCVTAWREVPAFGVYFALYDICKDLLSSFFAKRAGITEQEMISQNHSAAWASSAIAGGTTGALTWIMIYPFDVIKTRIQTAPMETPLEQRRLVTVGMNIAKQEGIATLFHGLNVTIMRAFPVNAIVFPVYEFCLMKLAALEY